MDIVDEILEEPAGGSSKRWLLLILVFVAGMAVAVWLLKRRAQASSVEEAIVEPMAAIEPS